MTTNDQGGPGFGPVSRQPERKPVIEDWMKEIHKVSRKASFDWPGIVEQADMVQDVCLHILERPGTQVDLAEMDDNARYRTLHKIAQRIASQERTDYEHFTGNFRYSVNEVRKALEAGALMGPGLRSSWSAEEYVSTGSDHSSTVVDMVSMEQDLRVGISRLEASNQDYHGIILRRFVFGEVGMDGAERMQLSRALGALTTEMNRSHKTHGRPHLDPDDRKPVDDWAKYNDWAEAREAYEDALGEIHEPTPELVGVGPDGLGIPNIRGAR